MTSFPRTTASPPCLTLRSTTLAYSTPQFKPLLSLQALCSYVEVRDQSALRRPHPATTKFT